MDLKKAKTETVFSRKSIVSISVLNMSHRTEMPFVGLVRFKADNTTAEQSFDASSAVDALSVVSEFVKNLAD